jgi:hypothetical protein
MCFVKIGWVAVTLYSLLVPSSMVQQLTAWTLKVVPECW